MDYFEPETLQPINYPLFFNGGKFFEGIKGEPDNPLQTIRVLSLGLHSGEQNLIIISDIFYRIKGEDEDGLVVLTSDGEKRVNQRQIPLVNWTEYEKPIHASLSILIGEYRDGKKKKLAETTSGYITKGNFSLLQKTAFNTILNKPEIAE